MNQANSSPNPPEAPLKGSEVAFAFTLGLTAVATALSICLVAFSLIFAKGDGYYRSWYYLLSVLAFYISGAFALLSLLIQMGIPKDHRATTGNKFIQIALYITISIPIAITIWIYYQK